MQTNEMIAISLIGAGCITIMYIVGSIRELVSKWLDHLKTVDQINNFDAHVAVLEYHMVRAYDIVYKDSIMLWSVEGMKIPDEDFPALAKSFATLTESLLGEKLFSEFSDLYGGDETLYKNMTEYFDKRLETDQIRKQSVDQLMDSDILEQPNV